ncbi:PIR protein [Plasmodium vivax]|uniref:PIR protein n=1 Tax=Plasmodium vivax TaxID=5855 RepID=A0A564ZT88_PLAVI|nr:PIR protein [Plasmodium vivax]
MDLSLSQEINEWKLKYPFLEHIWSLFEDFSNELVDDENELYIVCDGIAAPYHGKISEYKEFCKILLKNLDRVSLSENKSESETGAGYFEDNMDDNTRCINLNIWLYYYTKIHHVPDEFIEEVFSAMDGLVTLWGDKFKYTKCYYESYSDVYAEPEDLIKLLTFVDNEEVILNILMSKPSSVYYSCVDYMNECAKIYRKLNTRHCKVAQSSDKKYINLCQELKTFEKYYTSLHNIPYLKEKIPHLDSPQLEHGAAESQIRDGQVPTNEHTDFLSSPLKSKITTAVTAGVGACGFLGFLYKFTPVRSWFSARNRAAKASILLDDGPNEMLYNSPDSWNMESDNTEYNIGYHSTEDYNFE